MPHYDEKTAEGLVFTFKDGLLSKMAHDLKLAVTRFTLDVDPALPSIRAEIDPASLRVIDALVDGKEDPKALSASDKEKIAIHIQSDVLESGKHGQIVFTSRSVLRRPDGGHDISGDLQLHGTTRLIQFQTRLEAGKQVAEIELNQPEYGIVPFKAMLGALKVKPAVRVRISVPNS
jgi:polyisoprenoid-binding protein YceI